MVNITSKEIYEKYIKAHSEQELKAIMIFGLTLEEIMERIEYYDEHNKKSLQGKINEAVWNNLWPLVSPEARIAPMDIVYALKKDGLEIVEIKDFRSSK